MSLAFDTPAASLAVTSGTFDLVSDTFDVFNRPDLSDELIIDTNGWDPVEEPLKELSGLLKETPEDLVNLYLVLYVE